MDRITEITEATFNALAQLRQLDAAAAVNMPELLHQQMATMVEQAHRGARQAGLSDSAADAVRYALVALADETVLSRGGPLADFWLPRTLQLRFFQENVAGDGFYDRLETLRGDRTQAEVLRVYYLCLLFGFRGKYRMRGGEVELADLVDSLRDELRRHGQLGDDGTISPHGGRPYEAIADAQRNSLLIWIAVAAAAGALLGYLGMQLSILNRTAQLVESLHAATGG